MDYKKFIDQDKKFGEITVYHLDEEARNNIITMLIDNMDKENAKLNIGGTEMLGNLMKMMTDFPVEFIENEEIFEQILKRPSDDMQDAIDCVQDKVQTLLNRFKKQQEALSKLPKDVLAKVIEKSSEKVVDQDYLDYLRLKETYGK